MQGDHCGWARAIELLDCERNEATKPVVYVHDVRVHAHVASVVDQCCRGQRAPDSVAQAKTGAVIHTDFAEH